MLLSILMGDYGWVDGKTLRKDLKVNWYDLVILNPYFNVMYFTWWWWLIEV